MPVFTENNKYLSANISLLVKFELIWFNIGYIRNHVCVNAFPRKMPLIKSMWSQILQPQVCHWRYTVSNKVSRLSGPKLSFRFECTNGDYSRLSEDKPCTKSSLVYINGDYSQQWIIHELNTLPNLLNRGLTNPGLRLIAVCAFDPKNVRRCTFSSSPRGGFLDALLYVEFLSICWLSYKLST